MQFLIYIHHRLSLGEFFTPNILKHPIFVMFLVLFFFFSQQKSKNLHQKEFRKSWDNAWDLVAKSCNYTNGLILQKELVKLRVFKGAML